LTFTDVVSFADGTLHTVEFFVTRLHPTAPIVLGLPWLQEHNPDINWTDLSLGFRLTNARISAALCGELQIPTQEEIVGEEGEEKEAGDAAKRSKEFRRTVELEEADEENEERVTFEGGIHPEERLGSGDPLLMDINEWLQREDESRCRRGREEEGEVEEQAGDSINPPENTANPSPSPDSPATVEPVKIELAESAFEQKFREWESRWEERTSNWPARKQRRRWKYQHSKPPPRTIRPVPESINKIPSRDGWTPRGSMRKVNFSQRSQNPVLRTSDPNIKGKPISLIGAAAMSQLLRDGTPAYMLHTGGIQ